MRECYLPMNFVSYGILSSSRMIATFHGLGPVAASCEKVSFLYEWKHYHGRREWLVCSWLLIDRYIANKMLMLIGKGDEVMSIIYSVSSIKQAMTSYWGLRDWPRGGARRYTPYRIALELKKVLSIVPESRLVWFRCFKFKGRPIRGAVQGGTSMTASKLLKGSTSVRDH